MRERAYDAARSVAPGLAHRALTEALCARVAMTLRTYRRHRDHATHHTTTRGGRASAAELKSIRRVAADEIIELAYAAGAANTTVGRCRL